MGKFDYGNNGAGTINYHLGFDVDFTTLSQLKNQLEEISKMTSKDYLNITGNGNLSVSKAREELKEIKQSAAELQNILNKSYNSQLGSLNLTSLKKDLSQLSGIQLQTLYNNFNKIGLTGKLAFKNIAQEALTTNTYIKQGTGFLDKMATTFGNTVRYGISSSIFNRMVNSLSSAWNYTKALDSSLNDIRIVSGKSADEMERFAVQANKAAQKLGTNTKEYTNAALIYEQQGLDSEQVQARTDVTLKTANVTGQDARQVSEQLTAIWNGYKVDASEAELYIDKVAKVAATTAADLEELSTGMSKVASAANTMGVDIDQLNAMLATVVSVTREAPETIGTSFRTIFARLGDLKTGGTDGEIGLGKVSGQLKEMGVNILDQKGNMREMGEVIEDIAGKWENWTRAQKQAVAVAMAGKMQYSRFIALFDNWDMYTKALNDSKNATGELQKEQDVYMESISAHLKTMSAATERFQASLMDKKGITNLIDGLTGVINLVANFNEATGTGIRTLTTLGAIASQVFGKQLQSGITSILNERTQRKNDAKQIEAFKSNISKFSGLDFGDNDESLNTLIQSVNRAKDVFHLFTEEQQKSFNETTTELISMGKEIDIVTQKLQEQQAALKKTNDEIRADKSRAATFVNDYAAKNNSDFRIDKNIDEMPDEVVDILDEVDKTVMKANSSIKTFRNSIEQGTPSIKTYRDALNNLVKSAQTMQKTMPDSVKGMDKLNAALDNIKKGSKEDIKNSAFNIIKGMQEVSKAATESAKNVNSSMMNVTTSTNKEVDATKQELAELKRAFEELKNYLNDTLNQNVNNITFSQSIVQTAQGILQLGAAISTITALPDIFENNDLSDGEKFLQLLMAFGNIALMLAMSFPALKDGIQAINKAFKIGIPNLLINNLLLAEKNRLIKEGVVGEALDAMLTDLRAKKTQLSTMSLIQENAQLLIQKILTKDLAVLKGVVLVAAIAAVSLAVWGLAKAYNADAEAAKKAAESAEQAAKIYTDAKNKYEELKSAIKDYKDAQKAIKELTTGTEEWKEAIKSANDQVLELMRNYPELAKYVTNNKGQLTISDEGLKEVQENREIQVQNTLRNNLIQQSVARNAANKNDTTQLQREFMKQAGGNNTNLQAQAGFAFQGLMDALKRNPDLFVKNEQGQFIHRDSLDFKLYHKAIENLGDDMIKLTDTIAANTKANEVAGQQIAHTYAEQAKNGSYNGSQAQDIIDRMITANAKEGTDSYKKEQGKFDRGVWGWSWLGFNNYSDKQIHDMYAKAMGWDTTDIKDQTGKATFKLSDGTEYEVQDDAMREYLKTSKAYEHSIENINQYIQTLTQSVNQLNTAVGTTEKTGQAVISTFVGGNGGNFGDLTSAQVQDLEKSNFKNDISTKYKDFGYTSAKAFQVAIEEAFSNFHLDENIIRSSMLTPVRNVFNSDEFKQLTLNGQRDVSQAMSQMYKMAGSQGLTALTNVLKDSGKDIEDVAKVLNSIDWTANDAPAQLTAKLKEQGLVVNTTTEAWRGLEKVLKDLADGKYENAFDKYRAKLSEAQEIIEAVSKSGKTITDEQYEQVLQMNANAASMFRKTIDGYKYIGKSSQRDSLLDLLTGGQEGLEKSKKQLQAAYDFAHKLAEAPEGEKNNPIQDLAKRIREDSWENGQEMSDNGLAKSLDILTQRNIITEENLRLLGVSQDAYNTASQFVQQYHEQIHDLSNKTGELTESEKTLKGEYDSSVEILEQVRTGLQQLNEEYTNGALDVEQYELMIANSQTSIKKLDDLYKKGVIGIEAYNDAYANLDNVNDYEGIDAEALDDYADYLQRNAKTLDDVTDSLAKNSDEAEVWAKRILKMNNAIDDLANNMEQWYGVLTKDISHSSAEFREALKGMRDDVADLLDVSDEWVSDKFILDHLAEIKQAATGSEIAIDGLQSALSKEIVAKIRTEVNVSPEEFDAELTKVQDLIKNHDFSIEASLDDKNFVDALNDMILKTGMSTSQVNALFDSMGYEATFASEPQEVYSNEPTIRKAKTITMSRIDPFTGTVEFNTEEKVTGVTDNFVKHEGVASSLDINSKTSAKTVPKINKIIKKPTGSMNNYSSKNAGGKSPGKSSKSGGSSSKPSHEKRLEKEKDPYHDVNIQLALTESNLKLIQSQNDKTFGTKKIENYNKQIQLLNNKLDLTKQKLAIARQEQQRLGGLLAARGATFNADGTIANYAQLYEAQLAHVNNIIDTYNGMSKEQQENYKQTLDDAKEDFSKFEQQLKDYDDNVQSIIPGLITDMQSIADEKIELEISKFNMEFEIRLDMAEAEKDWNEFKKKVLDGIKDDDIFGNAAARARDDFSVYLNDRDGGLLPAGLKQTQDMLEQFRQFRENGWASAYGDNETKLLEDMQAAYQNVEESLMDIVDIQDDLHQAWLDTMDDIDEKMQDQIDMYEQIDKLIEHDKKIIELVYGETDFDALDKYYDKQHQNNLGLLDFARQNAEFWKKEMLSIADQTSEEFKSARNKYLEYLDQLKEQTEKTIEDLKTRLENAIDGVFKKFNNQITNGKGLDYLQQQWDLINDNADRYLDTVNAAFGIRDLERKYKNAIDQTDNVGAQRKLNDLMEQELKQLRDKDKLTEYDIERAQKKYEIALKQIALEEAQQTKNTMRLRRDSQGNYRYEYVADEDNISKLQEELDALQNSLYNFDKDRFIELQDEIIGLIQEREEAIKEVLLDAELTEEERQERIAEINRLYNEQIEAITDQTVTAQTNLYQSGADELSKIWAEQGQQFQDLSDAERKILVEQMLPQFQSGVNEMINAFKGENGFEKQTIDSMNNLKKATDDYKQKLNETQQKGGEAFNAIRNGQDAALPTLQNLIRDNQQLNHEYEVQLQNIKNLNAELDAQLAKYRAIIDAAKAAADAAHAQLQAERQRAAEAAAQERANQMAQQSGGNGNGNGGSGSGSGSAGGPGHGGGNYTIVTGDTLMGLAARFAGDASRWTEIYNTNKDAIISEARRRGMSTDGHWIFPGTNLYIPFHSGGYTGNWDDNDGRLAVLHKKELVLNAKDTENMLNMMHIAREVIASAGPRVGNISAQNYQSAATAEALEQNVHIDANFPNVESASEIEEALNNLVNLAAQRANRKIR